MGIGTGARRRGGRSLLAVVVLLVLAACSGDDEAAPPSTTQDDGATAAAVEGRPAASADAFVDTIGVNVHLNYVDTAYRDFEMVRRRLDEAGIRHVRDGLVAGHPRFYERLNALADEGIRTTLIMGEPLHGGEGDPWGSLRQLHDILKRELIDAVEAVEGPNEYDLDAGRNPDWRADLVRYQRELYALVKGDPVTEHLPVLAPSLVHRASFEDVGDLSLVADLGNLHPYPDGEQVEASFLDDHVARAAQVTGDAPVVVTETGYHNAVEAPPDNPLGHEPTSEEATAVYLPRKFLQHFDEGVVRTFLYELVDQHDDRWEPESSFGLLRSDFSPKPSFTALSRLIALLSDPGPAFVPGHLDVEVSGDDATRSVLLQQRDGTFFLALWQEEPVWDPERREPLTPGSTEVVVDLHQPVTYSRVHDLSDGGDAPTTASPTSVRLPLSAEVVVLELGVDTDVLG